MTIKTVYSYKLGSVLSQMREFRNNSEGPTARSNKSRHVCAVTRGSPVKGRIVSMAINHTTLRGHFHAEEAMESTFRNLVKTGGKYNVIVARFLKNDTLGQSDPCQDCATMLYRYREVIHRVYYTTTDPTWLEYGNPIDILEASIARNYRTNARVNGL